MCNCCVKTIKTTAVQFQSNQVIYTIPATVGLNTNQAYNIIFCQPLPNEATLGSSIVITDGTTNYNVLSKKSDSLLTKYIINRCGLKTWFGGTTFVLRNFICIQ